MHRTARDETLEHVALQQGTPKAITKRLLSQDWGLRLYGYLDGSYTQNFNNPSITSISFVSTTSIQPVSTDLLQVVLEKSQRQAVIGNIVPASR